MCVNEPRRQVWWDARVGVVVNHWRQTGRVLNCNRVCNFSNMVSKEVSGSSLDKHGALFEAMKSCDGGSLFRSTAVAVRLCGGSERSRPMMLHDVANGPLRCAAIGP